MIMSNGMTVVGCWRQGLLHGQAIFICPLGGKIHANLVKGKVEGWVIMEYGNNFEINHFKNDERDRTRARFDEFEELWVQSRYLADGKLDKVMRVEKVRGYELPSFLSDPNLI